MLNHYVKGKSDHIVFITEITYYLLRPVNYISLSSSGSAKDHLTVIIQIN